MAPMRSISACSFVFAVALTACVAPVGVKGVSLPSDSTQQCADVCRQIGTTLADVVVMANNVGCVCEPRSAAPAPPAAQSGSDKRPARNSAATAGGVAAVLMAEEAQRQSDSYHH